MHFRHYLASTFVAACFLLSAIAPSHVHGQAAQSVAPFSSGNLGSHMLPVGPAPTPSGGCSGSGAAISANANDANGTITGTTAATTSCVVTFAIPYATAPDCVASGITAAILTQTVSTTSITVTYASVANFKWSYVCFGK